MQRARRPTLVTVFLAALWFAPSLQAEEARSLDQTRSLNGAARHHASERGAFTVPYRLVRKWGKFASASDEAIEDRVLQAGTVLGQPLFSDVEIKGNTIYLWLPFPRAVRDPDRWSLYADLADMMVVRCRCTEGTVVVGLDAVSVGGETYPAQYFRFDAATGRSRIDLR